MTWENPRWASLTGPDSENLRAIFASLEKYFKNPVFGQKIALQNGVPVYDPVKDVTVPPPEREVTAGDLNTLPADTGAAPPQVTGVTVTAGFRTLLAEWDETTQNSAVRHANGTYEMQLATDAGFTVGVATKTVAGPPGAFDGLAPGTTYHVRVRSKDYYGRSGAWSATASAATALVTAPDLTNAIITTEKLAGGAVDTTKLADLAVDASKLGSGAVTPGKLADLAVEAAKLANSAVTAEKIANLAVGTAAIANAAITDAKIANLAVGSAAIQSLAVGTAHIADAAIVSAKIGDLQVGTAKIADLAVSNAKIADLAVDNAKIANLNAAKITAGTIDAARIGANSITASHLAVTTSLVVGQVIQSSNYTAGSAGWRITGDGNAEFNNVTVRGTIESSTITGGTIRTAASGQRIQMSNAAPDQIQFITTGGAIAKVSGYASGTSAGIGLYSSGTARIELVGDQIAHQGTFQGSITTSGGVFVSGASKLDSTLNVVGHLTCNGLYKGLAGTNGGASLQSRGGANGISFNWTGSAIQIFVDNTLVKSI